VSLSVSNVLQFPSSVDFEVCLAPSEASQLSTEQRRQHAAVDAEHSVQSQQQIGIAKSFRRSMMLCQVLEVLAGLGSKPFYRVRLLQWTTRWSFKHKRSILSNTPGHQVKVKVKVTGAKKRVWVTCDLERLDLERSFSIYWYILGISRSSSSCQGQGHRIKMGHNCVTKYTHLRVVSVLDQKATLLSAIDADNLPTSRGAVLSSETTLARRVMRRCVTQ